MQMKERAPWRVNNRVKTKNSWAVNEMDSIQQVCLESNIKHPTKLSS